MDMAMEEEKWTSDTWYTLAKLLEAAAMDKSLPKRLRKSLLQRAEACWVTGDFFRGVSPEDWENECAVYRAEDAAMEARNSAIEKADGNPKRQLALELA